MKVIIYDVEVLKKHWTIVLKYYGEDTYFEIVDNVDAFRKFYEENQTNIWAGFNVKHYDLYILRAILSGMSIAEVYNVSKQIIEDKIPGWRIAGIKRFPIPTFDLSQDIQGAPFLSLKEAEANMGLSIVESPIPFTIERELSDDEINQLIDYNVFDVYATEKLFEARFEHFEGKIRLINHFNLGMHNVDRTTAQLTAMVMDARKPRRRTDEMVYERPGVVDVSNAEILDLYRSPINYKKTLDIDIAGIPHRLAYGGLHGAKDKQFIEADMVLLDVSQYYPSMMNEFDFISRNVRNPEMFEQITTARTKYKAAGDPMDFPFKIMIAATYGAMKNRYNGLYDPRMPNQVCITGQLLLIDLLEKMEPYITHIQSNTDGLLVIPHDLVKVREIVKEWESRTGMVMDEEWGVRLWQKDVNNYIFEHADGSLTIKGGYVRQYYKSTFSRNTNRIIDRAVVDYIVHDIYPEQTIHTEKELSQFQMIAKSGRSFDKNIHIVNGEEIEVNKVSRVFATTDKGYGGVVKIKEGRPHRIPNTPDHCVVYNEDIREMTTDDLDIDKQWYIDFAWDRIRDFGVKRRVL